MADTDIKTGDSRDDLLVEVRERYDYAVDGWREIRAEGNTDMRYVAGDPWEPEDRSARVAVGRPCLSLDELSQYYNQVINDVRANPIAMKFDATGNGANDKGAVFYADKAREIEYRSHAQIAYTTAFENAVQRSYGWVRLKTDYAHERTEEQDLSIEDIPDPNSVVCDPDAKRPDSSDVQYLFVVESYRRSEFRRRWPRAKIQDFSGEIARSAPAWVKGEQVQVGEYWKIKTRPRKLALFRTPDQRLVKAFEDEALDEEVLPAQSVRVRALRDVDYPSVCQYLTTGVEILEETDWPGKYIPFASCFGKVLYLDEGTGTKRKLISMTRLARDPYMLYCYVRTCEAEVIGGVPRNAWLGYEGQFAGHETDFQRAHHEPVAYLEVKAVTDATGSQVLPLPSRQPWDPPLQNLEISAEAARRAIQAAMMGSPLPTSAQRKNEKSGVALKQIEASGQKGSFHFVDHYKDMIRHVGVMVEDLMDKIYDTTREVGARKTNETAYQATINDPNNPEAIDIRGDYLVTVSTGPNDDSTREASSDFADTLIQMPQLAQVVGPQKYADLIALAIRLKNVGPVGDEMSELISPKKGEPGDPQAAQQQLQQLQAENQQLQQQLQQAAQAIQTDQAKQQGTLQKAQIDAQVSIQIEQMKAQLAIELRRMQDATAIAVAHIQAASKGLALDAHAAEEAQALGLEQQEAERSRMHEQGMARMGHEASMQQGALGHQQTLEQAEQAGAQQLQTQQQAAELAAQQAAQQATNGGGA